MAGLGGRVIACLEARSASELADLVTRHGGIHYQAACLREVHEPDAAETRLAVELISGDWLRTAIFLTAGGIHTIVEGARRLGLEKDWLAGLATKRVAVRGPKTLNALRRLGVRVDLVAPEPFTSDTLLHQVADEWRLVDDRVLVQRYGAPVPALTDGLRRLGAEVVEVSPYRWERPEDEEPVVRLIEDLADGWIDVLAATSAAQIDFLFAIAARRGYEAALRIALARPDLCVAAQGLVCASAFVRHGVRVDLVPRRASMGALIVEIATEVSQALSAKEDCAGEGTVAFVTAAGAAQTVIENLVGSLRPEARVAVLAGKTRVGDRLVEQTAIARGLAVEQFRPSRGASHPADQMIRQANRVIVVCGPRPTVDVGRVLRLADRYAKPVQVVDQRT